MKRLLLIDPQDVTRIGVKYIASSMLLFDVIDEGEDKNDIVSFLDSFKEGVVIIDYTMTDMSEEYLLILSMRYPNARFIIFSESLSTKFIKRILIPNRGFSIVMKDSPLNEIKECIAKVSTDSRYICKSANVQVKRDSEKEKEELVSPLTVTEREILKLLAMGKTTKDIANERFLSVYTIMTHRKNIFRKLSVNNVHEATKYALRSGIVDPVEYYI